MPPVASTTICEKPMTMSMASERPSEKRLKGERKPGASEEKTIQKPTTMTSSPICADAPASTNRRRAGVSRTTSSVMVKPPSPLVRSSVEGEIVRNGVSRRSGPG